MTEGEWGKREWIGRRGRSRQSKKRIVRGMHVGDGGLDDFIVDEEGAKRNALTDGDDHSQQPATSEHNVWG